MRKLLFLYRQLGLKRKLVCTVTCFMAFCVIATNSYLYSAIKDNQLKLSVDHLKSIRESKSRQIENYFEHVRSQVVTMSRDHMIIKAMEEFSNGFELLIDAEASMQHKRTEFDKKQYIYYKNEYGPRMNKAIEFTDYMPKPLATEYLQYHYISNNQHPVGKKQKLYDAQDGSRYSQVHQVYHQEFKFFLEQFGYYDIFLVDSKSGNIVYSVFKEVDFATNLLNGPHKESNFGHLFRDVRHSTDRNFVKLVDFAPYDPSYGAVASFIASPIIKDGENIGVLVFQMPIQGINDIMTGSQNWFLDGLGLTGESIIVGGDGHLRNQSRFLLEDSSNFLAQFRHIIPDKVGQKITATDSSNLLMLPIDTSAFAEDGHFMAGHGVVNDYRGIDTVAAYAPLNIKDVDWQFLTKIDQQEALQFLHDFFEKSVVYCCVFLLVLLPLIYAFSVSVAKPIEQLNDIASSVLTGHESKDYRYQSQNILGKLSLNINGIAQMMGTLKEQLQQAIGRLDNKTLSELDQNVSLKQCVALLDSATNAFEAQYQNKIDNKQSSYRQLKDSCDALIDKVTEQAQVLTEFKVNRQSLKFNSQVSAIKHGIATIKNLSLDSQHDYQVLCELQAKAHHPEQEVKNIAAKLYAQSYQINMLLNDENLNYKDPSDKDNESFNWQYLLAELQKLSSSSTAIYSAYLELSQALTMEHTQEQQQMSQCLNKLNRLCDETGQMYEHFLTELDMEDNYQQQVAQIIALLEKAQNALPDIDKAIGEIELVDQGLESV